MAVAELLQRLTRFDRFLVLVLALLVAGSFLFLLGRHPGSRVIIETENRIVYTAPLEEQRLFDVEGPLGVTRMQIENGAVRVLSSPCPQKICIGLGAARNSGDLLACVPNRILVRIEGARKGAAYDLLSR
jgi:hypothetical protein